MNCPNCDTHIFYLNTIKPEKGRHADIITNFACPYCKQFFENNITDIYQCYLKEYIGHSYKGKSIFFIGLTYKYYDESHCKLFDYNEYPILIRTDNSFPCEYTLKLKDLRK